MNALAYNAAPIASGTQDLQPALFTEFVAWIDRGERTTRAYMTNLKQFAAWMKYASVTRPQRADVISYRDYLTVEHDAIKLDPEALNGWSYRLDATGAPLRVVCKPNTVAQYMRSVCQFFRWTAANGLYPDIAANIHAPKISHDNHRKEALEAHDVLEIERSITRHAAEKAQQAAAAVKDTAGRMERATEQSKRLFAMYQLAVTAGLRTVEISRANVKDFQTKGEQSWLYIWGKGHTEPDQKKPIAPEVAAALNAYLDTRADKKTGTAPLFVATGNRSKGKRIAPTTISKMLKGAMIAAGYNSDRLTAHSLRHTAGTACMELTGDIYTTQKYMRHANPQTTEIYLHNDTEKAEADIAKQLYGLYHGRKEAAGRTKLETIIDKLTPQQIEQLTGIATAIAG